MTGIKLAPVSGYLCGWLPRWALAVGLLLALAGCGNLETLLPRRPTALATPPSVERLTEASSSPTASASYPHQPGLRRRSRPTPTSAAVPTSRVAAVPSLAGRSYSSRPEPGQASNWPGASRRFPPAGLSRHSAPAGGGSHSRRPDRAGAQPGAGRRCLPGQ